MSIYLSLYIYMSIYIYSYGYKSPTSEAAAAIPGLAGGAAAAWPPSALGLQELQGFRV